jgi:hypothetical protein
MNRRRRNRKLGRSSAFLRTNTVLSRGLDRADFVLKALYQPARHTKVHAPEVFKNLHRIIDPLPAVTLDKNRQRPNHRQSLVCRL